jgi:uncharacterized protein (DUF2235 family)
LYLKGIGKAARTFAGDKIAQAFGFGGHKRIRQMIERLENNFEFGDQEIDIVGFSRGAALAISFANEIAKKMPTVSIRFIGVWDIVGEFGIAGEHINAGHDLDMPPNVQHCYHAMALDECRAFFQLTRLTGTGVNEAGRLVEVWFRGVHSDIGGGNGNFGLNWIALNWMFENARRHNLKISPSKIADNLKRKIDRPIVKLHKVAVGPERKIRTADLLHSSVQLDSTIDGRQRNDPKFALARIDDMAVITPVTPTLKV